MLCVKFCRHTIFKYANIRWNMWILTGSKNSGNETLWRLSFLLLALSSSPSADCISLSLPMPSILNARTQAHARLNCYDYTQHLLNAHIWCYTYLFIIIGSTESNVHRTVEEHAITSCRMQYHINSFQSEYATIEKKKRLPATMKEEHLSHALKTSTFSSARYSFFILRMLSLAHNRRMHHKSMRRCVA